LHEIVQEFIVRDEVMLKMRPKRSPPRTQKKFHAWCTDPYRILRSIGSDTYELDILWELELTPPSMSTTFHIVLLLTTRSSFLVHHHRQQWAHITFMFICHHRHHRGDIWPMRLRTFYRMRCSKQAMANTSDIWSIWEDVLILTLHANRPRSFSNSTQTCWGVLSLPFTIGKNFWPGESWWESNQDMKDIFVYLSWIWFSLLILLVKMWTCGAQVIFIFFIFF